MNQSTSLLDAVAVAALVVDDTGRVVAANPAFTELTGWSAGAAIGRPLDSWCGDVVWQRLLAAPAAAQDAQTGLDSDVEVECDWPHADGTTRRPARIRARRSATGARVLTLVDCRAEHAWRERALHAGEMLDLVQEFGRLGIWERDPRTLQGHWDRHVHRFFGLPPDAPTPDFTAANRFIVPEDRDGLSRAFYESLRRECNYAYHYRVAGADGELRRLHSRWRVRNDTDGSLRRIQGVMTDDTEVWRLAQSYSEAQDQLRLAVELAGIAIWRHDLATNRLHYSDQGWRILGREPRPDGLTLDEVRALIHPDDLPEVRATMERALASRTPVDMEARYRHADGRWLDILTRRVAQRDEAGRPLGFIGVAIDITERQTERRRLQELTRRLDMAAAAAGVGVWSFDVTRREAHWNAQMYALHGVSPETPAPDWDLYRATFVDRRHAPALDQRMKRLVTDCSDHVVSESMRIRRADGVWRDLSVRARALRDGDTVRMIGTMIDVTDQRADRQALREANARVALAARAAGVGIWERDAGRGIATWDEQMWRLRGLEPRGSAAPSYDGHMALVHPDDRPALQAEHAAARAEQRPWSVEFRVRWPDGSWHWLASRSTPILDETGREMRRLGVNWDITDERNAEAARQERTAALRDSRAKSAFLARMSHELRTPLHAVIGFAQLLRAGADRADAESRDRIGHIEAAGHHLLALVDDVLDLSSLDAGDMRLDSRCLDLRDAVDAVLPMVAAPARAHDVAIDAGGVGHLAVQADPTRLRQVLLNLLTNAVKYNRRGGRVVLQAHADGELTVLAVRDTGRGMTPEQLAHVFEPFNRLGVEREGIEGTGIGLAIVKVNAERMGGAVAVSSEPGVGSCFEVRLPNGQPEPLPAARDEHPPAAARAEPPRGGRLLYIEDNPVNALIVRELLAQRRDLLLDEAADGSSGIAQARRHTPDLILLDMQLPDIDGLEVLRRLRADPATAGIPCIALSANAMPDDIQRALAAGFNDYWTKPLDFRVFMGALESRFGNGAS